MDLQLLVQLQNKESVNVISEGLSLRGDRVMTKGVLTAKDGKIIYATAGIRIIITDLRDFMIDTPENRKILKSSLYKN